MTEQAPEELGWFINTVTPRVYELRGRDERKPLRRPLLVEGTKRICTITKRRVIAWQLNLAGLIPELCPGCGSEHVGKYDKRWCCGNCGRTFPSEDHPPSTISWKKEGPQ